MNSILKLFGKFFFILLLLCISWQVQANERGPQETIRVGIFPFEPFNFIDTKGVTQGLNPDLLLEIVKDEKWGIEFIPGNWAEGLERLQTQEIDLMVSVAHSPERAKIMDYTYESVVELWGQVFVRPEGKSYNIDDLSGRKIAIMRRDISGSNFLKTAEKFGVACEIQELATHAEVFAAVKNKEADAGVAPQHFGLRHAGDYNLIGTTILFSPFSIYFTSKKGTQHELLSHIDAHLSKWKSDKESFYYQSLNRWMGRAVPTRWIPAWLAYSLITAVCSTIIFAGFVLILKRTVRRKTDELRESEGRFRDIALSMSDRIWEANKECEYYYCSKHVTRLLGYKPEEVVGKKIFDFMPPEQALSAKAFFDRHLEKQLPFRYFENWNLHKEGHRVCLLTSCVPAFGGNGELLGYRGIDRDITKQKKIENELKEYREHLETLVEIRTADLESKNKEMETFTYSVSHDLKAPLRGIDGYSRLLIEEYGEQMDEQGQRFLKNVVRSAEQMNQLIEDLLAYSRMERRDIQFVSIDLPELIDSLIREREQELINRHVKLKKNLSFQTISGDRESIRQIVGNLLDNAIKFTKDKPVATIDIKGNEASDVWTLCITDNGVGFDSKYKDRIFGIFQRLHLPEEYPGTGVGLAIVQKAINRMEGRVWAESESGKGAAFYIEIPKIKKLYKNQGLTNG